MGLKNQIEDLIGEATGNVGVSIKNLNTDEIININEERVFPSASTIKIVVMAEILKKVKEGKLHLNENITVLKAMKTGGDGILKELDSNHEFSLKEIMTLMIIISDNTAANLLIDTAGMEDVNEMAGQLGMKHTKLKRKMMDADAVRAGRENLTCAADMTNVLEKVYDGEVIDKEYSSIMMDILKRQQVKGRLDLYLPDDTMIAHKTGDLDRLEHDVGIVFLPECRYIISVLTNETPTNKDGREIIGKISRLVYDSYNLYNYQDK